MCDAVHGWYLDIFYFCQSSNLSRDFNKKVSKKTSNIVEKKKKVSQFRTSVLVQLYMQKSFKFN